MPEHKTFRVAGVVANVSWTSLEQVLRVAVSFLVSVQVINYLGPDRFGLYSYVISIVGILAPLTAFGLEQVVIRQLVERPDTRDRLIGTAFVVRMGCGVLAYAASLGIVLILDRGAEPRLRLTAVASVMLLLQGFDTVSFFFKAIMGAKYIALSRLFGLAAMTIGTIALLVWKADLPAFLWMRAVEAGATGLALVFAYRLWGASLLAWRFDGETFTALIKAGFPLFIASFAVMIYMRIDQVMLGQMASEQELGYYGVAVRLAEVLNFVPVAVVTALYPSLVESRRLGEAAFKERLQGIYNLMALIGYAIAGAATVAASFGFHILFGTRYDLAVPMFVVLVWGMLFICLGVAMTAALTIIGRFWMVALTTALGMVVNVGLNFWLIPRLGGLGSAWATLVAYWVAVHGTAAVVPWLHPTFAMLTRAMVWPNIGPLLSLRRRE